MKIISSVSDINKLSITAIRLSDAHIEIYLDGTLTHKWIEPCLQSDEDVWDTCHINGVMYDVNYVTGDYTIDGKPRITFYGLYEDDSNDICRNDERWYQINLVELNDLVLEEMKKDFVSGDLTAITELLKFVPIENLIGYLPEQN